MLHNTKLALNLTLPGFNLTTGNTIINSPTGVYNNLGGAVTGILEIVFYFSGFLLLFWLTWGVFKYLTAEGQKESLLKARNHMRWALVGFIVIMLAFVISRYVQGVVPGIQVPVTNLTGER